MRSNLINQISPWNIDEENLQYQGLIDKPLNYFSQKSLSPLKLRNRIFSETRLEYRRPKMLNTVIPQNVNSPKLYNLFGSSSTSHQQLKNLITNRPNFSSPHKTQKIVLKLKAVPKSRSKDVQIRDIIMNKQKGETNVTNSNNSNGFEKSKNLEINFCSLKTKLQIMLRLTKCKDTVKKNPQKNSKLTETTHKISNVVFQSIQTVNPFNFEEQNQRKQKKSNKNLHNHYLDKLIGKYN